MTDLNLLGPMLRLVHRYYEQTDAPDAARTRLAWAMLRLVGDDQGDRVREVVRELEGKLREVEPLLSGDWTMEDDRLVLIGRIADTIETMPLAKLQIVLEAVVGIRDLE